jgi:hypothetical protein
VSFWVKYKVNVMTLLPSRALALARATTTLSIALRLPNYSPRYNQLGRRPFSYQAPVLWNDLPLPLRELSELNTLKKKLNTF